MIEQTEAPALVGCEARIIQDGEWRRCRLAEISPRGALLEMEDAPPVGEQVVACISEVGALAGTVEETSDGRCAIAFRQPTAASAARMSRTYSRAEAQ